MDRRDTERGLVDLADRRIGQTDRADRRTGQTGRRTGGLRYRWIDKLKTDRPSDALGSV